ncbi:MAG: HAD family hydrolase [Eubacterium sp.]|nr:HAD family hydrolase [Eubacterium sp.]
MMKCVIFDFDGTLVNTETDVIYCFNKALISHGYPEREYGYIRSLIGKNLDQIVTALLPDESRTKECIDLVKTTYREFYASYEKPNTKPFTGIKKLLDTLKSDGVKIAINSNKGQDLLEKIANDLFGTDYFDAIFGYNVGVPSKPDPYGVQYIMDICKSSAEDTLYVGDSEVDILTAKNAGIKVCAVGWGVGNLKDMIDIYGVSVYNDTDELITTIK